MLLLYMYEYVPAVFNRYKKSIRVAKYWFFASEITNYFRNGKHFGEEVP